MAVAMLLLGVLLGTVIGYAKGRATQAILQKEPEGRAPCEHRWVAMWHDDCCSRCGLWRQRTGMFS
jgi:membrane protein DedA with SNARE-associated domain